jgi:hypothetical protein
MKKKVVNPPQAGASPALTPRRPRESQCFRCDGTGLLCDDCGESQAVGCGCGASFSACEDCGGTGK